MLNNTLSPQVITYEFQAVANGCTNLATISTNVTVSPAPEMTLVNNEPVLCSGEPTDINVNSATTDAVIELINVVISPNPAGVAGHTPVGTTWSSALGELPVILAENLTNTTNSIQTITYEFEVSASGFTGTNLAIAEITVNPSPDLSIVNTNTTINSAESTDILINTLTDNGQVAISNIAKTDPALIGNTASGVLFTDGARLEDVLLNSTPSVQTITYTFEARANGCVNPVTIDADVDVNPSPEMTITNNVLSVCRGELTDIDVNSITADAIIELIDVTISPNPAGLTGHTAVGTTWQSSLAEIPLNISDNLVNGTDSIQTITYEFEVSASGFISTQTQTVAVVVNPQPALAITNTNTNIKSGETTSILIETPTENGQVELKTITKSDPALIGNTRGRSLFPGRHFDRRCAIKLIYESTDDHLRI